MLTALFVVIATGSHSASAQTYPNPSAAETDKWRQLGECRDPWVTRAVSFSRGLTNGVAGLGDYGECNPANYNNGQWSSYDQLYKAVQAARYAIGHEGLYWDKMVLPNGNTAIYLSDKNGKVIDGRVFAGVRASSGSTAAEGAATVVAQSGGKLQIASLVGTIAISTGSVRFTDAKKFIKLGENCYLVIK